MIPLLSTYYYLVASVGLAACALVCLALTRTPRWPAILSGCVSILAAPWSLLLDREYWSPVRVWHGTTGIEDVVFSFGTGVIVWLVTVPVLGVHLQFTSRARTILLRLAASAGLGTLTFAIFRALGAAVMPAVVGAMLGQAAWLLARRPSLWHLPLVGAVAFSAFHLALVWVVFHVWPHARHDWHLELLSGVLIAGVPGEEVLWAAGFGVLWPLLIVDLLDGRPAALR